MSGEILTVSARGADEPPIIGAGLARPSDSKTSEELLNAFENAVDARAKTEIDAAFEETTQAEYQCANGIAAKAREDLVDRLNRLEGTVEEFGQRLAAATSRLSDAPTTEMNGEGDAPLFRAVRFFDGRLELDKPERHRLAGELNDIRKSLPLAVDEISRLRSELEKREAQLAKDDDFINAQESELRKVRDELAALREATPLTAEDATAILAVEAASPSYGLSNSILKKLRSLSEIPAGDAK